MSTDERKLEQSFFERTGRKMSALMKAFLTSTEPVEIKSLEGAPSSIGGDFKVPVLTSIDVPAETIEMLKKFDDPSNAITSLERAPSSIGGDFKVPVLTDINAPAEALEGLKKFDDPSNALKFLEGSPVLSPEIKIPAGLKYFKGGPVSVFEALPPQGKITSLKGAPKPK